MKIKEIANKYRPRERLIKYGACALSDPELLAIILQNGTKNENVVEMCKRIFSRFEINKLGDQSIQQLQQIQGIGLAKASQIIAVFEISKRYKISKSEGKIIKCAKDVFDYCSPKLSEQPKEHFVILHLDTKNRVIKDEIISIGTLNSSIIHPREVFRLAIKENVNSIILVHNHPSGDPTPSKEDKEITAILFDAGKLLSINVLDHVIIGKEEFWSFDEHKNSNK